MSNSESSDLRLLSWNILAPCWVLPQWYPSLYEIAANHRVRLDNIIREIRFLQYDVLLIQEAQQEIVELLKQELSEVYIFHTTWNHPTDASVANGLLAMIRKQWKYCSLVTITDGILDPKRGEAIQIIKLSSMNINIVNLHLNYMDSLSQAKMILERCRQLIGTEQSLAILAGDLNAEKEVADQFDWNDHVDLFHEQENSITVPTYYPDPGHSLRNTAIDYIFYDASRVKPLEHGKAWGHDSGSLQDALTQLGSDHIYVWASFQFLS